MEGWGRVEGFGVEGGRWRGQGWGGVRMWGGYGGRAAGVGGFGRMGYGMGEGSGGLVT